MFDKKNQSNLLSSLYILCSARGKFDKKFVWNIPFNHTHKLLDISGDDWRYLMAEIVRPSLSETIVKGPTADRAGWGYWICSEQSCGSSLQSSTQLTYRNDYLKNLFVVKVDLLRTCLGFCIRISFSLSILKLKLLFFILSLFKRLVRIDWFERLLFLWNQKRLGKLFVFFQILDFIVHIRDFVDHHCHVLRLVLFIWV